MRKKRVLFMVEAVTLAHPARSGVLAAALSQSTDLDVYFACDDRYEFCLPRTGITRLPLNTIASQQFLDALAVGKPVHNQVQLEKYIQEDMALIRQLQPDLIVGDFRLSLAVSAPTLGVPLLNITNAHWSDYSTVHSYPVPELPITKWLGEKFAQWVFDRFRPLYFFMNALPLNRCRKKYGLRPLSGLKEGYSFGNYVAYMDLASLEPMRKLPPSHRFIGPVWWSSKTAVDPSVSDFLRHKPLVYITLGSSGAVRLLPQLLGIVGAMPVFALVATAGRTCIDSVEPNVKMVEFADGDLVAQHASAVICNGGNATLNQALAAGVPVLGIPNNLDQFLTMASVCKAGAGISLRASEVQDKLRASLDTLLHDDSYTRQAQRLQEEIQAHDSAQLFVNFVNDILANGKARSPNKSD